MLGLTLKKLGLCEGRVGNLEKNYKPFKTKIDHLTKTTSKWNTERFSRDEFTNLADNIESTSNKILQMKLGEHKETPTQSENQKKDETTIVLNRLPKKPNQMPQALLTSLHILLGLPIMAMTIPH